MSSIVPCVVLRTAAAFLCLGGELGCGVGGGDVYLTKVPHSAHKRISSLRLFSVSACVSTASGFLHRQSLGSATGNIVINYSRKLREVEVVVINI